MKNKLLYTEVTEAAEKLATALRKFSGESMYCNVSVVTRDTFQDATEAPDLYTLRVHETGDGDPVGSMIIAESGFIYRAEDGNVIRVERQITAGGLE